MTCARLGVFLLVSSIYKTDRHEITEILLKAAVLNTYNKTRTQHRGYNCLIMIYSLHFKIMINVKILAINLGLMTKHLN